MRLTLLMDHRFRRDSLGQIYSPQNYTYSFFRDRYLSVFEALRVIARVDECPGIPLPGSVSTGPGVVFKAVPSWHGPWNMIAQRREMLKFLSLEISDDSAVCAIAPSFLSSLMPSVLEPHGHPFGLEVVGDPYEALGTLSGPLPVRIAARSLGALSLRELCSKADAVLYVTKEVLQKRYPAGIRAFSVSCSDVVLHSADLAPEARRWNDCPNPLRLVCVASMDRTYKGHSILLRAAAECEREGLNLHVTFVGDGRLRPSLEREGRQLGIADRVLFVGQLPAGAAVMRQLDMADLFVLPSLTEGLPRSLVEAMARALPCLASAVGGVPELLPLEDTVPPNVVKALAEKLVAAASPTWLQAKSLQNLVRARLILHDDADNKRRSFLAELQRRTADWNAHHVQ